MKKLALLLVLFLIAACSGCGETLGQSDDDALILFLKQHDVQASSTFWPSHSALRKGKIIYRTTIEIELPVNFSDYYKK